MPITGPHLPTTELVAVHWLRQAVAGLEAAQVGTTLPSDLSKWPDGFLTATALPTGAEVGLPQLRHGYMQLDAWAHPPASGQRPPWGEANRLVELVHAATEGATGRVVELPANYLPARVLSAYLATEPERIEGDPSGFARYRADLALEWVRA